MAHFPFGRLACLMLVAIAILTSSCATVVKGGSQGISVKTDPPGAACELSRKGTTLGVVNPTPGTAQIGKSAGALDIACKKQGYLDATLSLSSSVQGWTFGNLILGGIVGLAVDAGSGAMHEYQPEVSMRLLPERFESEESRDAYFDTWRTEVLTQSESAKAEIAGKCSKDQCEKLLKKADAKIEEALTELESSRKSATIAPFAAGQTAPSPPVSHIDTIPPLTAVIAPTTPSTESDQFLKFGDRWKYKFSDRGKVVGSVTVEILGSNGGRVRERFTREGYKGFAAERDIDVVFSPSRFQAPIAFPGGYLLTEIAPYLPAGTELKAGQIWDSVPGIFSVPPVGKKTIVSQVRVVRLETVGVPAGNFSSWRIETDSEEEISAGVGFRVKCTFWYSPEMKRTIKMTIENIVSIQVYSGTEVYELASFDPGK